MFVSAWMFMCAHLDYRILLWTTFGRSIFCSHLIPFFFMTGTTGLKKFSTPGNNSFALAAYKIGFELLCVWPYLFITY